MKRKFVWKRLFILIAGGLGLVILACIAVLTIGRPLMNAYSASLWTVDPARAQQAARDMLDYQLPEGYAETRFLSVQGRVFAVIITSNQQPEDIIMLQSIEDGIIDDESWRQSYEESWSKGFNGHRYQMQMLEIRQMQIDGISVPVRLLEGKDEHGNPVKQAVCILQGKAGDMLVALMSSEATWDFQQVEAFYRSIHR